MLNLFEFFISIKRALNGQQKLDINDDVSQDHEFVLNQVINFNFF